MAANTAVAWPLRPFWRKKKGDAATKNGAPWTSHLQPKQGLEEADVSRMVASAPAPLAKYSAQYIAADASIRAIEFEAKGPEDARAFAATHGFGLVATPPVAADRLQKSTGTEEPAAYDLKKAQWLLGGASRTTIYRLRARGQLKQLKGTKKILITRASIQAYCAAAQ